MASAWVGDQARTIVPDKATAAIDMRLVPESNGNKLKQLVIDHIKKQGYHITTIEPTEAERKQFDNIVFVEEGSVTDAFRTDLNNVHAQKINESLTQQFNQDVVKIRIMGGTVPIVAFINELNIPAVIVPMVNPDNNQHSPNENLRIQHVFYGIEAFYSLLTTSF